MSEPCSHLREEVIRARRAGVPSYKLAAQVGIHPNILRDIVNERTNPTADEMDRIAAALGKDTAYLFGLKS